MGTQQWVPIRGVRVPWPIRFGLIHLVPAVGGCKVHERHPCGELYPTYLILKNHHLNFKDLRHIQQISKKESIYDPIYPTPIKMDSTTTVHQWPWLANEVLGWMWFAMILNGAVLSLVIATGHCFFKRKDVGLSIKTREGWPNKLKKLIQKSACKCSKIDWLKIDDCVINDFWRYLWNSYTWAF